MDPQYRSRVKRGRPPSSSLPTKILEGLSSDSQIKCPLCNRDFPRNKSLQAHLRTHTGEKPYECDYPRCLSAFTQSGHLRSHAYRHTGEKLYGCPMEGCKERFIHSNRHCSEHKSLKLIRDGKEIIRSDLENLSKSEIEWLQRYREKKLAKSTSRNQDSGTKRSFRSMELNEESCDQSVFIRDATSPSAMINSETSGYSSLCSSEQSSPVHYEPFEDKSGVRESFTKSPKRKKVTNDIENAAKILMDLKNRVYNIPRAELLS